MRAKYIKPRKGAKNPKWRIQYFDGEGKYLGSEMGYRLKELTVQKAEDRMRVMERKALLAEAGIPQATDRPALELMEEYIATESPKGGLYGAPWSELHTLRVRQVLTWWIAALKITKPSEVTQTKVDLALNATTWHGSTKNSNFVKLNAWMNWCRRRGHILYNPLEDNRRYNEDAKVPRRPLQVEEAWKLFNASPEPFALMYMGFLLTGMRSTAMSRVEVPHIDWTEKVVRVPKKNQKTKKAQEYPLPDWYLERLRAYVATLTGPVLFPFMDPVNQATKLQRHLRLAGVPFRTEEGKVDIHALRVTFGTWVNESGADPKTLAELLGHADPKTSLKVYVKPNQVLKRTHAAAVASRLLEGGLSGGTSPVQIPGSIAPSPVLSGLQSGQRFRRRSP